MPHIWLFSTDPEAYPFDALFEKGRDVWDGVKNPLAQRYLREVRKGDTILGCHTQAHKCLVALARAASDSYPDPKDPAKKLHVVDVEPVRRLLRKKDERGDMKCPCPPPTTPPRSAT